MNSYCKRGDPTKKYRFGYPKPYAPATVLDPEHRCTYQRDVGDAYVNNYNPYLLAVFRTFMDIQYNDGPEAVRYLANYLAKDDDEAKILLKCRIKAIIKEQCTFWNENTVQLELWVQLKQLAIVWAGENTVTQER